MEKKGSMYKPRIGNIDNNQKIYYSYLEDKLSTDYNENSLNIEDFLKNLNSDGSYIFNKDVVIETFDDVYNTRIAGKIGSRIVTLDNRSIDMKDIKKIYEKK